MNVEEKRKLELIAIASKVVNNLPAMKPYEYEMCGHMIYALICESLIEQLKIDCPLELIEEMRSNCNNSFDLMKKKWKERSAK